jgi:hypothetical protein
VFGTPYITVLLQTSRQELKAAVHCPPVSRQQQEIASQASAMRWNVVHTQNQLGDDMSKAHYELHGGVAVIRLDNPPVNGLGHALRQGIVSGIQQAEKDDRVNAVVVIGSDKVFSGGADITEFGTPKMLAEPICAP